MISFNFQCHNNRGEIHLLEFYSIQFEPGISNDMNLGSPKPFFLILDSILTVDVSINAFSKQIYYQKR